MKSKNSLNHTAWECKYHVIFIPKCRKKALYGALKNDLGEVFHDLAARRQSTIEEGRVCVDHVHMMISIPPKYAVSQVIGYIKGKSAIYIARFFEKRRNVRGHSFWARGFYVNTVGRDEEKVRKYIKNQEVQDRRVDQMSFVLD